VLFPNEESLFQENNKTSNHDETLNSVEKEILSSLQEETADLDALIEKIKMPVAKILQALSVLEMSGYIRKIQHQYIVWK